MQIQSISQLSTYDFNTLASTLSSNVSAFIELAYNNSNTSNTFDSYKLPFNEVFKWMVNEITKLYALINTTSSDLYKKIRSESSTLSNNLSNAVNDRLTHYVYAEDYTGSLHTAGEILTISTNKKFSLTIECTSGINVNGNVTVGYITVNNNAEISKDVTIKGNTNISKTLKVGSDEVNYTSIENGKINCIGNDSYITTANLNTTNIHCANLTCNGSTAQLTARYALWR